jgi:hypothetical protein
MAITGNDLLKKSKKTKTKEEGAISGEDLVNRLKTYQSTDISGVDQAYIDSFIKDSNTFLTTAEKEYGGVGWGNASSSYEGRNTTWQDLNARADAIGAWLYKNRSKLDSNVYTHLNESLYNFRSSGSSIIDTFKNAVDHYAQFKSEDEYNKWYEDYKAKQEMAASEEGALGWQKWLDDEKRRAEAEASAKEDMPWWEKALGYYSNGVTDTTLPTATLIDAQNAIRNDTSYMKPRDDWSEEQKRIYGYLYTTSPGEAQRYAISTNNMNAKVAEEEMLKKISESATSNFWAGAAHTVGAILASPLGLADYLANLVEANARGTITEDGMVSPFEYSQAVTEGITTNLNDRFGTIDEDAFMFGGKGWGDVYGLGVSIGQSMASAYALGPTGTLISYFGQGAASGVDEALSRGASEDQALLYGSVLGALEGVAEMIGVDNLFKLGSSATIKGFFKNVLRQAGAEGLEELITALGSAAADNVIMGDKSNFNFLVAEYMVKGMSEEEAKKKAWIASVGDVAYDAVAGFMSGAVSGGVHTSAQTIASNRATSQMYSGKLEDTYEVLGKTFKHDNSEAAMKERQKGLHQGLVDEALDIDADNAFAKKLEARLGKGKTLRGGQINRLLEVNGQNIVSNDKAKMKSAVEARLTELGETGDISEIADVIVKRRSGKKLTLAERAVLVDSKYGRRVSTEMNPDVMEDHASAWAEKIGTDRINYDAYNKELLALAEERAGVTPTEPVSAPTETATATEATPTPTKKETPTEVKFKASADGTTKIGDTEVSIKEIASVKNGEVSLRLEDDSVVSAVDVEFGSPEEGLLYENVVEMNLNSATANAFIKGYDVRISVSDYVHDFRQAYRYGELGIPVREMSAKGFFSRLTEEQKSLAYNLGKTDAKYKAYKDEGKGVKLAKESAKKEQGKGEAKGKLHNTLKPVNETQRASLKALGVLARLLNIDIYTFESLLVDGKRVGENGWYNPNTRELHIDLFAGAEGKGTMLYTAAHELTHHIRETLPGKFKLFADILFEHYGEKGVSVANLIAQKKKDLRANKRITPNMTEAQIDDLAFEEVVADACESFLADGEAIVQIAEKVKAKDKTLWEAIKDFFTRLVARIKEAYKGLSPDSFEGHLVAEMGEAAEQLKAMWTEMLVEASEMDVTTDTMPVEGTTKYSFRSLAEAAGFEAVENEDGTRNFIRNGAKVSKVTIADIENSPIGAFINYSLDKGDIDDAQAKKQKQMFADICTLACKTNDFSMAMQFVGSAVFTGMKANADKQYGTTYDFPSICTKTQAVIDAMSARMVELGRGLNTDEITGIYRDVFASGNPVPCPECYVFSRWIGIGGLLDNIKKYQDYYGDMSVTEVRDAYKKMHAQVEAFAKEQNLTFGKAKGALTSKLTKEYNKLSDKIQKAENQGEKVSEADRKRLAEIEPMMNTVKAMTWIESVYFANASLTKVNPNFRVPNDVLFDLNKGEAFASVYKEAWAFRTTQGAGYGKAITPYAEARLGEGILVTNNTTNAIKGKAQGTLKNYFLQQNGQMDAQARKALDNARAKQKNQAFIGGQRFQSTSDARYENASDYLLAALEMQAMHGMVQVYTKVDGAVAAFEIWGFSTNQSLMPMGGGLDADGKVQDTSVGGMHPRVATANREKHEHAGTITIGVNDNHIRALYVLLNRDFIIPYHASGGKADVVAEFRTIQEGQEKRGKMVRSTDYSRTQGDKVLSDEVLKWLGKTDAEIAQIHKVREARIGILTRGKVDMDVVRGNRFLSALYDKLHGGEWDGVKLAKGKVASQIFPNEFWDQSVTYEESGKITRDYLEYCEDLGFLHRFSGLVPSNGMLVPVKGYDENGNRVTLTDLAYKYDENGNKTDVVEDFYWKTITDRRMYGHDGQYLPQKIVTLNDTTTDTVTEFSRNNFGRQYDKKVSQDTAEKAKTAKYSDRADAKEKPRSAQEQRDQGYMLSESKFYQLYSAHKLTYSNRGGEIRSVIEEIRRNGFISTTAIANVLPTSAMRYFHYDVDGKVRFDNVVQAKYAPKKGDCVLFVPNNYVTKNDIIKDGFKPFDYEIGVVEYDYQPYYEVYKKAYDQSHEQTHEGRVLYSDRKAYAEAREFPDADVKYSIRREAPPKETATVYKLMKLGEDKKLYPLFIDGGSPVELGVWYNADSPSFENLRDLPSGFHLIDLETGEALESRQKKPSKAEVQSADNDGHRWMFIKEAEEGSSSATRAAKQYGGNARFYYNLGINGSGSVTEYALRPGWHAGSLPVMEQIGNSSMRNIRADNFVWVEGEISYDIDYQEEAESNPSGENDIPFHIPKDGAYIKGTSNFVTKGMTWYIAGAFKANRILGDREARAIVDDFNENIKDADAPTMGYDFPRMGGRIFNAETMALEDGNQYEVRHWERARDSKKQKGLAPDDTMPIKFSDRTTHSVSNRSLLAKALESVAQDGEERNLLRNYKTNIRLIEAEQKRLAEVRAEAQGLRFKKGKTPAEMKRVKDLDFEAKQLESRINAYDRKLLDLEANSPLKAVLAREKAMAYKRAEKRGKEALKEQREKDRERHAKTQRELMTRYQESRKKGIEGRKMTEMRYKIKNVVNELNTYLKGTKEKHIPIGMQLVVAEALDVVNMDTVDAEARIAKKREEMRIAAAKGNIEKVEKLAKEIEHIKEMGGNLEAKLERLKTVYDSILTSTDPMIANSHDEVISNTIEKVVEVIGNTPLRNMNLEQLEAVYDMYRMILTSIRNANKAFKAAKGEEISTIANGVISELMAMKKKTPYSAKALQVLSQFDWNNLKPVYAFERIGSANFTKVFKAVRAGEDVWARDMTEAQAFLEEQKEKHGYDSFDFDKKYTFASKSGDTFELDLGEIMSLYAYAKDAHAKGHLTGDGFVFDPKKEVVKKTKAGIKVTYNVADATSYNLSEETIAKIVGVLESIPGAKDFVDAMQDYLSTTMGEKGNEVSLALYDIKLFKNKVYFPLKVSHTYMAIAKEKAEGKERVKNKGFTKDRKEGAKNSVVLTSFMDVWADHVQEMSMYHAFTLPLEDFRRVFGYTAQGVGDFAPVSVRGSLIDAHGNAAEQYLDQFFDDINGGARVDSTTGIINKMTSLFKKSAVFASLSVVIQQPSAIARATALVDAKYFVAKPEKTKHKETWAEVKKYAPVAIIKEMGYFDTGMGKSSVDWLKGEKNWKDKVDDAISKAPALADELAWCAIWKAVKRETLHTHKHLQPNSEAFLQAVGERFTEVIVKTQVYDSTLARSGNMRSKDTGMKMATAFMAEPTTSINMLFDAIIQARRGNKRYARKAIGGVIASMILNSVLVSFVYAGRDDDEDKTYAEKYVGTLTEELRDSINPLTLIPFAKDIVSIVQGYDVERSDMAVITDLINAWNNLDSDNRSVYRKVEDFAGAVASIFGIPVKNIMRDARGVYNTVKSFTNGEKTTGSGIKSAITEGITGKEQSDSNQLYKAILKGDAEQIERINGRYKDQSAINSAIRKALRENDPRIKQAAKYAVEGDMDEYNRLLEEILAEGHFSKADIKAAAQAEINAMLPDEETSNSTSASKEVSFYETEYVYNEIVEGNSIMAQAMKEDIIRTHEANGKTRDEAEASFNNSFASYVKRRYQEGDLADYEVKDMLVNFCGKSADEAESKLRYWEFQNKYPDYDDLSESAVGKYYEYAAPTGISAELYYRYYKEKSKCKGVDRNGDGRADSGTLKAEILALINSLPLSSYQKDALYRVEGWKESTIWEAPWH